jgi:peptidyl-prolyl cis-trans isomerase A (cyclophilin A)
MHKCSRILPFLLSGFLIISLWGCNNAGNKKAGEQNDVSFGSYQDNIKGMVEIRTFDHYNRALKKGFGFFVDRDLVVTNLDWIKGAYKAEIAPVGTRDMKEVEGYTAYSHNLNLLVLKVKRNNPDYIKVRGSLVQPDTLYTLKRPKRKLFVVKALSGTYQDMDSVGFWPVPDNLKEGKPAFRLNHEFMGIVQERAIEEDSLKKVVLSKKWIAQLLKEQSDRPVSIYDLRTKTDKVYISHKKVAGFRIKTTMGDIVIRMHDETPKFRDNFIKLVTDQFYDSLQVHRVLTDFLIQMGAADSKYAKKDDVVGWKGPGYTLPTKIIPSLFHKRGAIAASKLSAARNPRNRSDGSQFFIISGRVFTNEELDDIEKEKGFRFTPSQREIYTSIGGAPYLDGDYTVFAEVLSGMAVVDEIAAVETYGQDRPVKDIRIKSIEIIKK